MNRNRNYYNFYYTSIRIGFGIPTYSRLLRSSIAERNRLPRFPVRTSKDRALLKSLLIIHTTLYIFKIRSGVLSQSVLSRLPRSKQQVRRRWTSTAIDVSRSVPFIYISAEKMNVSVDYFWSNLYLISYERNRWFCVIFAVYYAISCSCTKIRNDDGRRRKAEIKSEGAFEPFVLYFISWTWHVYTFDLVYLSQITIKYCMCTRYI